MEIKTRVLPADEAGVAEAAQLLRQGQLVALPTETVYGIAADARNGAAVRNIFVAKGRPQDNPLIVHVTGPEMLPGLVSEVPERAQLLMAAFCPGPLTIIMPRGPEVADECCAGLDTVGIRMPSHPVARAVIQRSGCAFAAPSANLSGKPSPTNAQDVFTDMDGRLPLILDGGECDVGIESTVLDVSGDEFRILRPGYVTYSDILKITDKIKSDYVDIKGVDTPKCPGMKYTHYSPRAEVFVVMGNSENCKKYIDEILAKKQKRTGVLSYKNTKYENADYVIDAGFDMTHYAYVLYEALREFDEHNIDIIYAQFEDEDGVGVAVKNRIFKSAGYKIVKV